jgi:hypothetical protein
MTIHSAPKEVFIGVSHKGINYDSPTQSVLEHLEANASWWGEAALACRTRAAQLPSLERESLEWQLQAAVYEERTAINTRFVERLRQSSYFHPNILGALPLRTKGSPVDPRGAEKAMKAFLP